MYDWTFLVFDSGQLSKNTSLLWMLGLITYMISAWHGLSLERFQLERRTWNHDLNLECWNLE